MRLALFFAGCHGEAAGGQSGEPAGRGVGGERGAEEWGQDGGPPRRGGGVGGRGREAQREHHQSVKDVVKALFLFR